MYKNIYLFFLACVVCLTARAQPPAWVPANGLVAWYPFNGTAIDESANTNNGTLQGATLTPDRFGNANSAYYFDGISSYIEIPDHASLRVRKITVAAWVNTDNSAATQVLYKGDVGTGAGEAYALDMGLRFNFKYNSVCTPSAGWITSSYNTGISNAWVFIVSTYDGSLVRNYVNGSQVSLTPVVGLIDSCVGGALRIGYQTTATPNAFKGDIDNIAIYNRALSDCEIMNMYQEIAPPITQSPQDKTVDENQPVKFGVKTTGVGLTYQWDVNDGSGFIGVTNGGVYSGATSDTLRISAASNAMSGNVYRCTVFSGGCVYLSGNATLTVNDTVIVSVHETAAQKGFALYPNPAGNEVKVLALEALRGKPYAIIDQLGRVLLQGRLQGAETKIDLRPLSPGIYTFRLEESGTAVRMVRY